MPNSRNAEENAPSRKYFIAASCEISRRRRARPQSRYSGSEKTSSATNSISRSFAEANSIMPPTANSVSGKTSVCSTLAAVPSRSASDPGTAAAWPANADSPPSTDRSANSSTLISVSASRRIQVNSAGPSTEIAPWAAISSLLSPIRMAGQHARDDQGDHGDRQLHQVPQLPGQERLGQYADTRRTEDDEQRSELAVLDLGRREVRQRQDAARSLLSLRHGDLRSLVGHAHALHRRLDRRLDDVDHRLRVDAEADDQDAPAARSRAPRARSGP